MASSIAASLTAINSRGAAKYESRSWGRSRFSRSSAIKSMKRAINGGAWAASNTWSYLYYLLNQMPKQIKSALSSCSASPLLNARGTAGRRVFMIFRHRREEIYLYALRRQAISAEWRKSLRRYLASRRRWSAFMIFIAGEVAPRCLK